MSYLLNIYDTPGHPPTNHEKIENLQEGIRVFNKYVNDDDYKGFDMELITEEYDEVRYYDSTEGEVETFDDKRSEWSMLTILSGNTTVAAVILVGTIVLWLYLYNNRNIDEDW